MGADTCGRHVATLCGPMAVLMYRPKADVQLRSEANPSDDPSLRNGQLSALRHHQVGLIWRASSIARHDEAGDPIPLWRVPVASPKSVRHKRTKFLRSMWQPATLNLLGLKRALVNRGDVETHLVGPKGSDVLCGHAGAGTRWSGWLQRSRSRTSSGTG